jgi:hypothetical protein
MRDTRIYTSLGSQCEIIPYIMYVVDILLYVLMIKGFLCPFFYILRRDDIYMVGTKSQVCDGTDSILSCIRVPIFNFPYLCFYNSPDFGLRLGLVTEPLGSWLSLWVLLYMLYFMKLDLDLSTHGTYY